MEIYVTHIGGVMDMAVLCYIVGLLAFDACFRAP